LACCASLTRLLQDGGETHGETLPNSSTSRRPPDTSDAQDEVKTRAFQAPQALARLAISAAIDQSAHENQARLQRLQRGDEARQHTAWRDVKGFGRSSSLRHVPRASAVGRQHQRVTISLLIASVRSYNQGCDSRAPAGLGRSISSKSECPDAPPGTCGSNLIRRAGILCAVSMSTWRGGCDVVGGGSARHSPHIFSTCRGAWVQGKTTLLLCVAWAINTDPSLALAGRLWYRGRASVERCCWVMYFAGGGHARRAARRASTTRRRTPPRGWSLSRGGTVGTRGASR
jgi:hypothetical protein